MPQKLIFFYTLSMAHSTLFLFNCGDTFKLKKKKHGVKICWLQARSSWSIPCAMPVPADLKQVSWGLPHYAELFAQTSPGGHFDLEAANVIYKCVSLKLISALVTALWSLIKASAQRFILSPFTWDLPLSVSGHRGPTLTEKSGSRSALALQIQSGHKTEASFQCPPPPHFGYV